MRRLLLSLLLMSTSMTVAAQVQQGSLAGSVMDAAGAPVSGAVVTLRDPADNRLRTTTTDAEGTFRLANLDPSHYQLHVEKAGLAPHDEPDLHIAVGQSLRIEVKMAAVAISATTEVSAEQTGLDRTESSASTVIDTERLEELPVRSRNYLEFVLLAPGVLSTPSARGGSSLLSDSGFSFAGLRPRSNTITIDGLANNDEFSGASRTELSLETVKEFEVAGHSWSAENGGGAGGSINVVTRSGTNALHGDAFLIAQSGRLNARPFLEAGDGRPSLNRQRVGLAAGGPLKTDRVFYYLAAERERTRSQAAADFDAALVDRINAALPGDASGGSSTPRLTGSRFPTSLDETEASAKVSAQVTDRDSLMGRIATTSNRDRNDAFHAGGRSDFSSRGSSRTDDVAGTASWMSILGQRTTNDLRGQLARRAVSLSTVDGQGPGVLIPGIAEFGRPYAGDRDHRQVYVEAGDTVGYAAGPHFLRVGADAVRIAVTGNTRDGHGGLYTFSSVEALMLGEPDSYRQTFGDPSVSLHATRTNLFLQDDWTRSTLAVSAGVRFDGEALPAKLGITSRQLSPRVGFAWSPEAKWVVRGGAGRFADRIPLAALERAILLDGTHGFEQVLNGAASRRLFSEKQGGALTAPLDDVAPSIATVRRGSWRTSSDQISLGGEFALSPLLSLSANALAARGNHLLRTVNVNLLLPGVSQSLVHSATLRGGSEAQTGVSVPHLSADGSRIDPVRGDILEVQPTASSRYRGLTLGLNRRLFQEVEWSVAYTLSKTIDDASDFDEQPQNPDALREERGPSRYDQRHRLVASALFELGDTDDPVAGAVPSWWDRILKNVEVAPIVTVESGRPYNATIGTGAEQAFPATARPRGYGRNSERLPPSATVNLRLLKYFVVTPGARLDVVVEAFNLLNRRNVIERNAIFGEGTTPAVNFGRALEAESARQIEFSLDYEF